MTVETQPYDTADYLTTPERIEAYLEAVLEDGDAAEIQAARDTVARARLRQNTGGSRQS